MPGYGQPYTGDGVQIDPDPVIEALADRLVEAYDTDDADRARAILEAWDRLDAVRVQALVQASTS